MFSTPSISMAKLWAGLLVRKEYRRCLLCFIAKTGYWCQSIKYWMYWHAILAAQFQCPTIVIEIRFSKRIRCEPFCINVRHIAWHDITSILRVKSVALFVICVYLVQLARSSPPALKESGAWIQKKGALFTWHTYWRINSKLLSSTLLFYF